MGCDNAQYAPSRLNNVVVGPKVRDWAWMEMVMKKKDKTWWIFIDICV